MTTGHTGREPFNKTFPGAASNATQADDTGGVPVGAVGQGADSATTAGTKKGQSWSNVL